MTPREFIPTFELKNAVLAELLRKKNERGEVPSADVRSAVEVLGCSERTVWRWLKRGSVPNFKREPWMPKEEHHDMLLRHDGSIAYLHETLLAEGKETVSARTMQRGYEREYATAHLTFTRKGFQAGKAQLPTTSMPDLAVNEEWAMDDTQLPVWCILPDGQIGKAQLQGIIDGCTRYIVSWAVSPYIFNTEDAVENLARAMAGAHTANGVFVGGKPRALRTDRGSNFVARATSLGLVAEDIERHYSEAYTPQQNGKIERWHQFKRRLKKLPGYDWSDYKEGDPRKAAEVPPREQLLTFEELVVEVAHVVRVYNTEKVHRALKMTPEACWEHEVAANPDLVQPANSAAIRASMRQSATRVLNRRRIEFDNRNYNLHPQSVQDHHDVAPEVIEHRRRRIDAAESKKVTIRFLHGRVEYVSVYRNNEYLGDAVWDKIQTVAQAGEVAQARRRHIKTMTLDMESIAKADAEAVAANRARVLESVDSGDAHYAQYDDPTSPSGDGASGRKSRTKKRNGKGKGKGSKSGAKAGSATGTSTRAQIQAEKRRQEVKEQAEYTRARSA